FPLSKSTHEDIQVRSGEATGDFSVRSAYKLLQKSTIDPNVYLQTNTKNFYRKLWNLHMPSKIKITVWKIAWNYIPTFSNLKLRRVMTENRCRRCGQGEEDSTHVFQMCPIGVLLRALVKLLYEGKSSTSWEISKQIKSYILELEGIKDKALNSETNVRPRLRLQRANPAIFFDAAFDSQKCRSASGLVVKNEEGRIVAAKSILHDNVASPFAAEAYAGYQATRLGIQMGYHILDIIGDSKTVITKCKNTNRDKSEIGAIISDIQSLKDYFQEVRFQFIPRVENTEAHRLAKETLKKEEE
ncbi:hypothetical protein Gotri_006013, partial [Gossypium trilobum]|nr:hypothetical protein [Gossypium trilobum]